jgi:hypothetical protein
VIIASDMVCCDSDAVGVTNTLLSFLSPNGVAIFAVPNPYHRYGIAHLIPTLQQHFHLFIRPISHSSFNGQRHEEPPSLRLTPEMTHLLEARLDPNTLSLIHSFLSQEQDRNDSSQTSLEDSFTFDLPERDYFEWLLLLAVRRPEPPQEDGGANET